MADNSIDDLLERLNPFDQKEIVSNMEKEGFSWGMVSFTLQEGIDKYANGADVYLSNDQDELGSRLGIGLKIDEPEKADDARKDLAVYLAEELGGEIANVIVVYEM